MPLYADSITPSPDKVAIGIFSRQDISKYGEGTEFAIIGSVSENVQKAADGTIQKLPPKIFVWAAIPSPDPAKVFAPKSSQTASEIAESLQDQEADSELGVDKDVEFPNDEETISGDQIFKP